MPARPHTRRAAQAARATTARRLRWLSVAGLVVAAVVVAVVLTSRPDDGPIEPGSAEQLAHGEEVFAANCAACHGEDLKGSLVGPSFLDEIYGPDHHADDAFRAAVANGVQPHHWQFGAMPPVPGLSAEDVDSIIAYVRSEQDAAGIGDAGP